MHNPHKLKHCSEYSPEDVLFHLKIKCPREGINMNKSNKQLFEFFFTIVTLFPLSLIPSLC